MSSESKTMNQYRQNAQGHLVPLEAIHPLELLRDDTVANVVQEALRVQEQMTVFKRRALSDINSFCTISAEQYGWEWG